MSDYEKGFADGNRAKKALQDEIRTDITQIEKEARLDGLIMARYVTAKNSKEEKAIDILINRSIVTGKHRIALDMP